MTGEDFTDDFERAAAHLPQSALTPWLLLMFDAMTRLRAHVLVAIADPERFGDFLRAAREDYVGAANQTSARLRRLALLMINFTDGPPIDALGAIVSPLETATAKGVTAWRRLVDALRFLHIASGAFATSRAEATPDDLARVDPILIREVRATLPAIERLCLILAKAQPIVPHLWEGGLLGLVEITPEEDPEPSA